MTNPFPSFWKIPFVILGTFIWHTLTIHAQIEVEPAITAPFEPEKLVTDVLKGDGIIITDVKFHGQDIAVGYFSDGASSIGIDEGILLTTGFAYSASSVVDRGNTATSGQNQSTTVFPELENLADTTLKDVAYYEISFIPLSDSIEFNYVFGSEEYPEFGCDCFNDVFGFFIYGDGFPAEGQNLATVPGTADLPVSIASIHPIDQDTVNGRECPNQFDACVPMNEHLYVDNATGTDVNYDGFTKILTARAAVEKCKSYTLKIGIADVLDQVWDSGVFLEANSFSANTFSIKAETPNLDGTIVEGCANADLVFSIPSPKEEAVTINISKNSQSTAVEGVDYEPFPKTITIPAGETTFSIPIQSMDDGELEKELDSLGIDLQISDCQTETVWIPIKDKGALINDLGEDLTICAGDTAQLSAANLTPAAPVLTFFSDPNAANLNIAVIPDNVPMPNNVTPTIMELEVSGISPGQFVPGLLSEVCINISHNFLNQIDVFLVSPDGVIIELTTDNGGIGTSYINTCFTPVAFTSVTVDAAPYSGQFAPEGNFDALLGTAVNGTWQLIVRDDENSGSFIGKLHNWRIKFNGGQSISYEWAVADSISCTNCPNPKVFPSQTTNYTLTATDIFGCTATDSITIKVLEPLPAPNTACQEVTDNSVTISWEPVPSARNYEVNVNGGGWERSNKGDFQHEITNLAEGVSVDIAVRANGAGSTCGAEAKMQTCVTTSCLVPTPRIDSVRSVKCTGGDDGQIFLSTDVEAFFVLGNDTSALGQTVNFTQLVANDYQVQVLSANKACGDSIEVSVLEPAEPITIQSVIPTSSLCFAPNTSFIKVNARGGTGTLSYEWENGSDPTATYPNQDSIGGLPSGNYAVLVKDENGCSERRFTQFNAQPDPLI
ncbi:MAG: choice-of-anchor L domain-containing protein, partial [Bacteroidota bacterium]